MEIFVFPVIFADPGFRSFTVCLRPASSCWLQMSCRQICWTHCDFIHNKQHTDCIIHINLQIVNNHINSNLSLNQPCLREVRRSSIHWFSRCWRVHAVIAPCHNISSGWHDVGHHLMKNHFLILSQRTKTLKCNINQPANVIICNSKKNFKKHMWIGSSVKTNCKTIKCLLDMFSQGENRNRIYGRT